MTLKFGGSLTLLAMAALVVNLAGQLLSQTKPARNALSTTAAIVFGVGSPNINAERSGTSIGIVVAGTLYLFDAGAGVERRIFEAAPKLAALHVQKFGPVFLTHLDMDHILGLAALLYYHAFVSTGQLGGTGETGAALTVYGPGPVSGPPAADREGIGTRAVMDHLRAAFAQQPFASGIVGSNLQYNPVVHSAEIASGFVYQDSLVTVTAFNVPHKTAIAFGFRIQTADRVIVISGDTSPTDAVVEACNGCDLLLHEVFGERFGPNGPTGAAQGHTSAEQLADVARRARPKHLVIYHDVQLRHDVGAEIIRKAFSGEVTFARDLDMY